MTDYGHPLEFGVFLTPDAAAPQLVIDTARLTEAVGFDLVTFQDHPYQPRFLDAFTLMSYVAASTTTIRVAPNVANLPLRPPAVLAKGIASLDILSGGRVALALGAGGFWDAIAGYGGGRLSPGQSVDALAEAITIIRALWSPGRIGVRSSGGYYSVTGARSGPAPVHEVPIWVGGLKPRMLALTGRLADGWVPSSAYFPPERLTDANAAIDEAAAAANRDPRTVRRLYNITGSFDTHGHGFLQGPPHVWAEQLAELTLTRGHATYILATDDPDAIRRFAAEVIPAVRQYVDIERYSLASA